MKRENAFGTFGDRYVTASYPIFVPARSRVWFPLLIPYPYSATQKDDSREEQIRYRTEVAKYVTSEFTNVDGFVLFDAGHRYQIDLPNGWREYTDHKSTSTAKVPN